MAKLGRPGLSASPEVRKKVADLIAHQVERKEIAAALGISLPTLRKHFGELFSAAAAKPQSRRGRPRFKPTAKQRRQCEGWAAFGMPVEDIARVFGIAPETLREYFAEELATGWAKKKAEAIDRLYEHAKTNASAAARVLEKIAIAGAHAQYGADAVPADGDGPSGRQAPPFRSGKKQEASERAAAVAAAGGIFAPPVPPRLVVDNS